MFAHIRHVVLPHPAGEDEGQEQAGASSAGHHQGECDARGREDQGGHAGVEPHQHQALGRLPQELHIGQSSCQSLVTCHPPLPFLDHATLLNFEVLYLFLSIGQFQHLYSTSLYFLF